MYSTDKEEEEVVTEKEEKREIRARIQCCTSD
jgi:hypothetical protein